MSRKANSIDYMEELIKKKEYRKARKVGKSLASRPGVAINAIFWVLYGMCFSDYKSLVYVLENLKKCSTHSPMSICDVTLNCALAAIRENNLYAASIALPEIREQCDGNKFRLAKALTLEGRIAYAHNDMQIALGLFNKSEDLWIKANFLSHDPWRKYNSLYLLKSMVASGVTYEDRKNIAEAEIYGANRTRLHNFRARVINFGINKGDDQFMKFLRVKFL